MELKNSVVVITGSTSGLGKALAPLFAQEDANVIVSGRKREETAHVAKELDATAFAADVTKKEEIRALAAFATEKYGRLDLWINNAGIWFPHTSLEKQDSERVHEMMEVNFFGVLYGCQTACAQMQKQQGGTIVNSLSTSAKQYRPNSVGYGASKNAAMSLTNALQNDPALKDVHIIGVYPGGMRTHFFDEKRPNDYEQYMDPVLVAQKIVAHLKKAEPDPELTVTRALS